MTCFWDGIISSLNIEDFQKIDINIKPSPKNFVEKLKKYNIKTHNVCWCGEKITDKQMKENYEAIQNYHINTIHKGYYYFILTLFTINFPFHFY